MQDIHPILAELARRLNEHDARFDRLEGKLQANTDTLTILVQSLGKQFGDIDRRFGDIDRRFGDIDRRFDDIDRRFDELRCFIELKFEEGRSDFRALREMQTHQGSRIDTLERAAKQ